MLLRGSLFLALVLSLLIQPISAQTPVVNLLGLKCSQDTLYEIDSALQCCSEDDIAPVPMADATACAAYCAANNLPSMYGRYLDGTYIECICLTNCSTGTFFNINNFKLLFLLM